MGRTRRSRGLDALIAIVLAVVCVVAVRQLVFPPGTPTPADADAAWERLGPVATVEIADTDEKRHTGLMFRESLPPDHGMYFSYPGNHRGGFYMKNTGVPLSIAFLDGNGVILDMKNMQPFDETSIGPGMPYKDALEMNQGWFDRKGVELGDRVTLENGKATFWRLSEDEN